MKTLTLLWVSLVLPFIGLAQTTIFSEDCGNPSVTTACASYAGWQNKSRLTFTASSSGPDVRTTLSSSGYSDASGDGNIFFINGVSNRYIQISGINTSNYTNLSLSFGILKTTNASNGSELVVEVSINGSSYTTLSYTLATGSGTSNVYYLKTPTGTIPSTGNLRIRFRYTSSSSTCQFRIDDIKLRGNLMVLPIELLSFNCEKSKELLKLTWETATESNNKMFVIERSADAVGWEAIGKINAVGNSATIIHYSFVDQSPLIGLNYYRLKQVDFDNQFEYSTIICVESNKSLDDKPTYIDLQGRSINFNELQPNVIYVKNTNGVCTKIIIVNNY